MTALQEKVLYEGLKDTFVAVHKSHEMNKELGTWERNIMKVSEDNIDSTCRQIARDVSAFIEREKQRGKNPSQTQIKNKIKEALNNL